MTIPRLLREDMQTELLMQRLARDEQLRTTSRSLEHRAIEGARGRGATDTNDQRLFCELAGELREVYELARVASTADPQRSGRCLLQGEPQQRLQELHLLLIVCAVARLADEGGEAAGVEDRMPHHPALEADALLADEVRHTLLSVPQQVELNATLVRCQSQLDAVAASAIQIRSGAGPGARLGNRLHCWRCGG